MTHARILLGELPRMTRDILEARIASETDMQVVGRCENAELERWVTSSAANVVILQAPEDGAGLPLLADQCRRVKFVVIRDAGRSARLHECRCTEIADLSPDKLLDAIRRAVAN